MQVGVLSGWVVGVGSLPLRVRVGVSARSMGRPIFWDCLAVLALFGWGWALLQVQGSHSSFVTTDSVTHYFPAAQRWIEGQGYRAFEADTIRGPGYPLALAFFAHLEGGSIFAAAKIVSTAFSLLFLLLSYLFVREVFGPVTALGSILLVMGINSFAHLSAVEGSDVPFAALAVGSLYFSARHERPTAADCALSGALVGLALTVRWTGLFLPVFILLRVALMWGDGAGLRGRLWKLGAYLLGFLLASGPWLFVNSILHGSPFYNQNMNDSVLDSSILPPFVTGIGSMIQVAQQEPLGFAVRFTGKLIGSFPGVIQGLNQYPAPSGWAMAGSFWVAILAGALLLLLRLDALRAWFLLCSLAWWVSLVPIHFEPRFFILLFPAFSALALYPLTGPINHLGWPARGGVRRPLLLVGPALGRLLLPFMGPARGRWRFVAMAGRAVGITAGVALVVLLGANVAATAQYNQRGYQDLGRKDAFYHDLSRFMRSWGESQPGAVVGVRQWSEARYWLPWEAGVSAVPLPRDDYDKVLNRISYLLLEQLDDEDRLYDGWDDPKLADLRDPLRVPSRLEAVYFKPDERRAVLYRVLDQNSYATISSTSTTSATEESGSSRVVDNDRESWWSSSRHTDDASPESILCDLGREQPVNRVWILPREGGTAFPLALRIEASVDGASWQLLTSQDPLPRPEHQNPQVFSFPLTTVRYVRVTATRLGWDEKEGSYHADLAEVRISSAVEKLVDVSSRGMVEDALFDPLSHRPVARVHNGSSSRGQLMVDFRQGWRPEDARSLGTGRVAAAQPRATSLVSAPNKMEELAPGQCIPLWTTVNPSTDSDLALESYGMVRSPSRPTFHLACSPREAVIDDFSYPDSPLGNGWSAPSGILKEGALSTYHDTQLDRPALQITAGENEQVVIMRDLGVLGRPIMSLWARSAWEFILYVRLMAEDGQEYVLQYMPSSWDSYPDQYPQGSYVYHPLGVYLKDGRWHKLERDLYQDFGAATGKRVSYVEAIAVRSYGELGLADLRLRSGW